MWHIWVNVWDLGKLCVSRSGRGCGVGDMSGKRGKGVNRCENGRKWVKMGVNVSENGRKWAKWVKWEGLEGSDGWDGSENGRKWAKMGGVGEILVNDIKEERVQDMDKAIQVRVVDMEYGSRRAYAWHDYRMNSGYTLQMAVKATYAAFPGACQAVVVRDPTNANPRRQEVVWNTDDTEETWMSDKYEEIPAGGEVEIWVYKWAPIGGGEMHPEKAAVGPQTARVAGLLGDLQRLREG